MGYESIGQIINSLPIETMVAAPVLAAVNAQKSISRGLADFVQEVGLDKDGNTRMVTFKYTERVQVPSAEGQPTTKDEERFIQAPFLALTGIPNFAMESVDVSFDLEVNSVEESKEKTDVKADTKGKAGLFFGPQVNFSTSVTHSSEQTRHTDTKAKYHFNVTACRQGPPESFMRIIDAITNSAAAPTSSKPAKENLLTEPEGTPATT